jgi:glycerol kinase
VWQDRRTAEVCDALNRSGVEERVRDKTGLPIDPYFSATKIAWILDNVEGARVRAEAGELAFGTVDTWFLWQLTGGAVHATDVTNASRTLLFDIERGVWSAEMLELFGVPESMLPESWSSSGCRPDRARPLRRAHPDRGYRRRPAGRARGQRGLLRGRREGDVRHRHLRAHAHRLGARALRHARRDRRRLGSGALEYALEGSIFMGGAAIQWIVEGLKLADSPQPPRRSSPRACPTATASSSCPALTGLGAPAWDPLARGAIFGLTRGSTDAHVARAAMEAIPLQLGDLMEAMEKSPARSCTRCAPTAG